MGRGRADGQPGAQLLARRQGATDPDLVEARRRLGVKARPVPVLGRFGVGPWDDWSKETMAQSWLRWHNPASAEQLQRIADMLNMEVGELPPMTDNTAATFFAGSTPQEKREAAKRLRDAKARWDAQGGKPAPWDPQHRIYDSVMAMADLVETVAAEDERGDLTRIQIEEKLAHLIGADLNRHEPLYYNRSWQSLLEQAGFDPSLIKAIGRNDETAAQAEKLSTRICRDDLLCNDIRLARHLMRSYKLRDNERFMPIRDLFVNPESDSIHGWLNNTQVGGRHDYEIDVVSVKGDAMKRGMLTAQLMFIRRDKDQPYGSDPAVRAISWLTSPSETLGGKIPADLIREDAVAHFAELEAAAAADPVESHLVDLTAA